MEENQTEAKLPEKTETIQQQTNDKPVDVPETQQQIDWKKFKEARRLERLQSEEIAKKAAAQEKENAAMKAAMEALLNKPSSQSNQEVQEETEESRTRRLINEALSAERKRVDDENRKKEHSEFPQRLIQTYNDFDQVCSAENLDYLEYHHPEIAAPYRHMPDGYEKWSLIYKAVKKYIPNSTSDKDQKKAEKNFNKPQSMAVGGATQTLDQAPRSLSDKSKADNWARMQRRMKGLG